MTCSVHINFLGPPKVLVNGARVRLPDKHLLTIAVLARTQKHTQKRAQLARLIWPNANERRARHSLSQAMYVLRRTTGVDVITPVGSDQVRLGNVKCDVVDFDAALANQRWGRAAELYTGTFLEGLTFDTQMEADIWIQAQRRQLTERATRILEEPLPEASRTRLAGLLLREDPHWELPRRTLLKALSQVDPSDRVADQDHGVGTMRNGTPTVTKGSPFVGRRDELRQLLKEISNAQTLGFRTVLLQGEPGIGKTTLARRFVGKAVLRGARTVQGAGFEVERNVAFGVLQQLLRDGCGRRSFRLPNEPWRSILLRSFPFLDPEGKIDGPPVSEESFISLMEAARRLLEEASKEAPLIVVVDDIHWADAATVAFLHFFRRESAREAIVLLLCARTDNPSVETSSGWSFSRAIELSGLSESETAELTKAFVPARDLRETTDVLHSLTAGNPFLIRSLLEDVGHTRRPQLTPNASEVIGTRLKALSDSAIAMAAILSIVGGPEEIRFVSDMAELGGKRDETINELVQASLVEIHGHRISLRHGIIGEAVLMSLPPALRATLHGRVARALMEQGKPSAVVADQFAMSGSRPQTFLAAMRAAEASAQLSANRETEYFLKIGIASAPGPNEASVARIRLADLLLIQGKVDSARKLLDFDAKGSVGARQAASLELYSQLVAIHGLAPPDVLEEALRKTRDLVDAVAPVLAAKLFMGIATAAHQQGNSKLASETSQAALAALSNVPAGPDRIRQESTALALSGIHSPQVDRTALAKLIEDAKAWPQALISCLYSRAVLAITSGEPVPAERDLLEALEVGEKYGLLDQLARIHNNLGVCYLEQGQFESSEQHLKQALLAGTVVPRVGQTAQSNLALLYYERGIFDCAIEAADNCIEVGTEYRSPRPYLAGIGIKGLSALALGHLSTARDCERKIKITLAASDAWSHDVSYVEIFLARMAILGGERAKAFDRLESKIASFTGIDFYCASRMEVEYLRLLSQDDSSIPLARGKALRPRLLAARALPLVEKLDSVLTRCRQ